MEHHQRLLAVLVTLVVGSPGRLMAQQASPPPQESASPEPTAAKRPPTEMGGRLVGMSETVDVIASLDEPPRTSSVATKTNTPLLETPRSVSIVERRTLDDLAAINLTQVHDYTLGMTPEDEHAALFCRGFRLNLSNLRRDGLRVSTWSVREPVALDRVQYLRGPSAVLYGDGSPGGLVNLVLKKPLPVHRYEGSLAAGGLGFKRGTVDLTGPLSAGRGARYRLVAAAEGLEDGFENGESRLSVVPMLSFEFGDRTTLHLDGEFYDQRGRAYRHLVPATPDAQAGDFSQIPWDLNVVSPDDHWRGWNASAGARLDATLSERTSLHVAGRYTRIGGDFDVQGLLGLDADGRTAERFHYREISHWNEYQGDAFVSLSAGSGGIRHVLVGGFEAGLSTTDSLIGLGAAPPLDIYDPVYAPRPPEPPLSPTRYDMTRLGVYVQDQIRFGQRLTAVPAVRASQLHLEDRAARDASAAVSNSTSDGKVSPSLGLGFLPRPDVSLYATYSDGFEAPAPSQFSEDGTLLAPVTSRSYEAGVKTQLLGQRLGFVASGFLIRQTNVPEPDLLGFYRQIGEGRSAGLELEGVGSPVAGLRVRAGYAYTTTEITHDTTGFVGNELPNAPRHKLDLWAHYRFGHHAMRGLAVGGGVVHVSERFTTRDNLVRLPPYTRFDAVASYEVVGPKLVLTLAVQNLTDVRYVTSGTGQVFFAGPPRRLAVSVASTF